MRTRRPTGRAVVIAAILGAAAGPAAVAESCYPDCDESGSLDFFDFLCFQGEFALQTLYSDCDESGGHDFFDFLCFQNNFAAGCPTLEVVQLGGEPIPPGLCGVEMTAFPFEPRPLGTAVTTVPSPLGGELVFDTACIIDPRVCTLAWCWGRGYDGRIYSTNGLPQLEIEMPPNRGFVFYMLPNPFEYLDFEVTGFAAGEEVSVVEEIGPIDNAFGFAFCGGVERIRIRAIDGFSDFSIGEFSIAD